MEVKNGVPSRAERTRETLLLHAREAFAQEGYAGTSLEEIVDRANLTKGALYHHFDSKLDLYRGVVEEMAAALGAEVEAVARREKDPWRRVQAMCDTYLDACLDSHLARILVLEAPAVLGWKRWCDIDRKHAFGTFAAALRNAMAGVAGGAGQEIDGGVTGEDERAEETLAQVVLGVLNTAARVIASSSDPVSARADVEGMVARLLAGIRPVERGD